MTAADETLTPAELADVLKTSEANILQWRRHYRWPSIKMGKTIRFTPEHVARIKQMQEVRLAAPVEVPVSIPGQTKRSQRRSA